VKSIAGQSVASFTSLSPSITSIQSILQPTIVPSKPSTRTVQRKQRSDRILSDLWLLTAHVFIKLGKLDEARKAIEEAENVDWILNPQVWCVLGQLLQVEGDLEQAQTAFYKSLVIDPNDVSCRLWLAKSHLSQQSQEIAEGILDVLTKSNGWNCAEAWYVLKKSSFDLCIIN
jgi:tetratricopeptide (TPR) repeat protein